MTTIAKSSSHLESVRKKDVVTLYVDMVGDLFHFGHICFLKKATVVAKEKFPNKKIRVVVGLVGDETAEGYKRRPILKLSERAGLVRELKLVDEVIEDCPLRTSAEFMDKHGIDLVAHGDDYDPDANEQYYGDVVKRDAMIFVPYTRGISTSDIIRRCYNRYLPASSKALKMEKSLTSSIKILGQQEDDDNNETMTLPRTSKFDENSRQGKWHKIWERKGKTSAKHAHHINGYNHQSTSQYSEMCQILLEPVGIKSTDKVVDCGCGAGAFLLEVKKLYDVIDFSGVDYSKELVKHARLNLDGSFHCGSIEKMPYLKSNTYDVVINFSVFHYLDDETMALNAVKEFIRIAKPGGKIYIGDVNDLDKVDLYHSLRQTTHANAENASKHTSKETLTTEHLMLRHDFFETKVVQELGTVKLINIVDHDKMKFASYYPCAPYRYSVYLEKL